MTGGPGGGVRAGHRRARGGREGSPVTDGSAARRIAVLVALGIGCTVTLAPHVRLYVEQERQKAALQAEIADRQESVAALEEQAALWKQDPFVVSQARSRLHYVFPGETGYMVAPTPEQAAAPPAGTVDPSTEGPWFRRVWAGLAAADE
jgi:cell division protein FtsB